MKVYVALETMFGEVLGVRGVFTDAATAEGLKTSADVVIEVVPIEMDADAGVAL